MYTAPMSFFYLSRPDMDGAEDMEVLEIYILKVAYPMTNKHKKEFLKKNKFLCVSKTGLPEFERVPLDK